MFSSLPQLSIVFLFLVDHRTSPGRSHVGINYKVVSLRFYLYFT